MENFLKQQLIEKGCDPQYHFFDYKEDCNQDVIDDNWLENRTSYIYKVGVMTAIDKNKCGFARIAIGVQRGEHSESELKGYFYFCRGENDDMGRVIKRFADMIQFMHPAFEVE